VIALVLLVPVAVAIYLARKLRTPPEPGGRRSRIGGPRIGDLSAIGLLLLPFLLIVLDAAPSLVVTYVVWSAGVVPLSLSDAWSARGKTLATLLAPGGGTLGLLLHAAGADSALPATARDVLGMLAVAVFAIAAAVPPILGPEAERRRTPTHRGRSRRRPLGQETIMRTRLRVVGEYLRELERSLNDFPPHRRNEIVSEIEDHIDGLLGKGVALFGTGIISGLPVSRQAPRTR
jgi:hypothetical protein